MNKRLRDLQELDKFNGDIENPAVSLTNPYIWKGYCRLGASFDQQIIYDRVGDVITNRDIVVVKIGSRRCALPEMPANKIHRLDWLEYGKRISFETTITGILTLYVFDRWMRPFPLGTWRTISLSAENGTDRIVTEAGDPIIME